MNNHRRRKNSIEAGEESLVCGSSISSGPRDCKETRIPTSEVRSWLCNRGRKKGQKSKENFDKKVGEALTFLRHHFHPEACFLLIKPDNNLGPIKEKSDLPKFQVTRRQYFSFLNLQTFLPVMKDRGRIIKGSGIIGFKGDPQTCLDKAGGDLRMLNCCSIFYKRCQEIDTIAKLMLLGVPNSINNKQIQRIMYRELIELEINKRKDPKSPVARYDMREWVK